MRHLIFSLFILAGCLGMRGGVMGADEEQPYLLLVQQAQAAVDSGDYYGASQRLSEALPLAPDQQTNLRLRNSLGMLYGQMGREEEAAKTFRDVVAVDSLNTEARYYLGMMALRDGRLQDAKRQFDVLLYNDPSSLSTAAALGLLYTESDRWLDALPYLRRMVDEAPALEYYTALGSCLLALERYGEASDIIARGLHEYPESSNLYLLRSRMHRLQYRTDAADEDARRAARCRN